MWHVLLVRSTQKGREETMEAKKRRPNLSDKEVIVIIREVIERKAVIMGKLVYSKVTKETNKKQQQRLDSCDRSSQWCQHNEKQSG